MAGTKDKQYGTGGWTAASGDTYKQTQSPTPAKGIGAVGTGLQNFWNDAVRNTGNFFGTIGGYLGSKDIPAGGGFGDYLVGSAPKADMRNVLNPGEKIPAVQFQPGANQGAPEPTFLQQMLDDLMANYKVTDGGYGNLISSFQSRAPQDRARLQALYDTYANDIASQEPGIAQNYATAAAGLGSAYDTAKSNIQAAYDAARQQQTQQLLALGLTDTTPTGNFGENSAKAIAAQEALRSAVLAQNEASRKAAITNNQLATEGARREGVGKVSSFDQKVADTLMQLQAKQAAAQQASANQLAQLRQNAYTNYSKMTQQEAANQLKADIAAMRYAPNPAVDLNALINTYKASGMSDADAINAAKAQAQYSGQ